MEVLEKALPQGLQGLRGSSGLRLGTVEWDTSVQGRARGPDPQGGGVRAWQPQGMGTSCPAKGPPVTHSSASWQLSPHLTSRGKNLKHHIFPSRFQLFLRTRISQKVLSFPQATFL